MCINYVLTIKEAQNIKGWRCIVALFCL